MENNKTKYQKTIPYLIFFLRIFIGCVFLFSGFTKAIDPWGTYYKIQEYITVFNYPSLISLSLFFSFFISAFEFIFGSFVLLGCYRRVAPLLLLLSMIFMLPLTLYIAISNNVHECGCFGEALHLSNWATFWKNVIISVALVYLVVYNKKLLNYYGVAVQWIVGLFSFVFVLIISLIGYFYQPLIDYRPFKVGLPLVDNSEYINEDPQYIFTYQKNGVRKDFTVDSLPSADWEFVDRKELKDNNKKIDVANSLVVSDNGEDITSKAIKNEGEQLILLFPDLQDVEISHTFVINEIYDLAQEHGIDFIGLTSATQDKIDEWNDLSMAAYKIYTIDDSVLKQIARGNPAIIYTKDGIVQWKRTLRSIPISNFTDAATDMSMIEDKVDAKEILYLITFSYLIALALLLIINRSHKVVKLKSLFTNKNKNKNVPLQS